MTQHKCKICDSVLSLFQKDIFDDRHGYPGKFDIYRCDSCGFGQTVPELPDDKISEIYTEYYPRKNVEHLINKPFEIVSQVKRLKMVRWWTGINNTAHFHIKKGTKVLDIGCGDCTSVREINAMGAEGYGIEPDQNIKPIVETFGLKVRIGLFNEMAFPDNYFDYITMSQVLEHIHQPVELLSSLSRLLKNGGQIILGVPNIDARLRKKYGNRWLNWHVPYHINHFSGKSISILADRSGYRLRKIETITPNLWVEIQQRIFDYPVREGVKVPFFNNISEPSSGNNDNPRSRIRMAHYLGAKIKSSLSYQLKIFQILLLRMHDAAGNGESYLAFLEKK